MFSDVFWTISCFSRLFKTSNNPWKSTKLTYMSYMTPEISISNLTDWCGYVYHSRITSRCHITIWFDFEDTWASGGSNTCLRWALVNMSKIFSQKWSHSSFNFQHFSQSSRMFQLYHPLTKIEISTRIMFHWKLIFVCTSWSSNF